MKTLLAKYLPIFIGAVVGAVGATLIQRTLPPPAGSLEERIAELEHELKSTQMERNELADTSPRKRFGPTTHDGVRSIAQRMKAGLPVTPDDLFLAFKPLMRDLAPLQDRIRAVEAQRKAESLAGEYARKYGLSADLQKKLMEHLEANQLDHAKAMANIIESDHIPLSEFFKAERDYDDKAGVDAFMAQHLQGEKLEEFQVDWMNDKSDRVQSDADLQVKRIDDIVKLDDKQRHQMFLYMAQTSRDYDPKMQFDGFADGTKNLPANMERREAMLSVLNAEQRAAYESHRQENIKKAQEDAARIGLTIPQDWDLDDDMW